MELMKIKGAIFDMDGTLVDSLVANEIIWNAIGEKYLGIKGFMPSQDHIDNTRTMIFTSSILYIKKVYNIDADETEYVQYLAQILEDFYRYTVKVKDGVIPFLEYLKSKGVKIYVASATNLKYVNVAIESCGLGKYIENVVSCADVGAGKDKPDVFLKTLELMQLPKEDVCVFEDSCIALETAKTIGLHTVGIYDKYNFGHDRLERASDMYIADGQTMSLLIGKIL